MHDGQNFHGIPYSIGDDARCAGEDQFASPCDTTGPTCIWIARQEIIGPVDQLIDEAVGRARVVGGNEILNVLKLGKGRKRPLDFDHDWLCLRRIRSRSAWVANSPRSAASIPRAIRSRNSSCHSRECPCSSASAMTCDSDLPERRAMSATRRCISDDMLTWMFIRQICHSIDVVRMPVTRSAAGTVVPTG